MRICRTLIVGLSLVLVGVVGLALDTPAAEVSMVNRAGLPWVCAQRNADGSFTTLSSHQLQHKAEEACLNRSLADGRTYVAVNRMEIDISTRGAVAPPITPPPSPVNCQVSAWSAWQTPMTPSCPASGSRTIDQVRTRTVTTEPRHDGQACPALTEHRQVQESCTPPVTHHPGDHAPIHAAPAQGLTGIRTRASAPQSMMSDGTGAFRIQCLYSHMALDDPIVFPGQPGASHSHTFFGNTSTNGNSTTESLMAATSSTCFGGIANRSSYWIPTLVDTATNRALVPFDTIFYYKSGYTSMPRSAVATPPNGLRMLAGKSPAATAPDAEWRHHRRVRFGCTRTDGVDGGVWETIPDCPAGSSLEIMLIFPNCWDGVNLDSADHRSHMAFSGGGRCPASHPVNIPEITLNVSYRVEAGANATRYRLSSDTYPHATPGGYSMHGDVWLAWDEAIKEAWMTHCVRGGRDCSNNLGDGRMLF